jgi:general stress protein 26
MMACGVEPLRLRLPPDCVAFEAQLCDRRAGSVSHQDDVKKVADLLSDMRFAMLTTVDADGTLISRPMAVQEVEFDGDLWFFAEEGSRKVRHVQTLPKVHASFSSGSTWVSVAGTATVVRDRAKNKELWNAGVEAWFPDGPDSGTVVLLKVRAETAEYWNTPGGRLATLVSFAKAKATGTAYDGGENDVVRL